MTLVRRKLYEVEADFGYVDAKGKTGHRHGERVYVAAVDIPDAEEMARAFWTEQFGRLAEVDVHLLGQTHSQVILR